MYISNNLFLKVLNHKEFIGPNTAEEYKWNYYIHEPHCHQAANSCKDGKMKNKFASIDNTVQIPVVWQVNQEISKCPAQFICRFCWDCTLWYFLSSIYLNERPLIFEAAHLGNLSLSSYIFHFSYTQVILGFFFPLFLLWWEAIPQRKWSVFNKILMPMTFLTSWFFLTLNEALPLPGIHFYVFY